MNKIQYSEIQSIEGNRNKIVIIVKNFLRRIFLSAIEVHNAPPNL